MRLIQRPISRFTNPAPNLRHHLTTPILVYGIGGQIFLFMRVFGKVVELIKIKPVEDKLPIALP